jgi:hypothetical protein
LLELGPLLKLGPLLELGALLELGTHRAQDGLELLDI